MADPIVGITNGVPTSGTGTITTLGQTLVDGANGTLGSSADAAIVAGAAGTINAHLRAISRDIAGGIVLGGGANTIGAVTQAGAPWSQNVSQFGGSAVATGTGIGGAGIPRVTVSSDSTHPVTQSGAWNITNISGTISLPTGAATSAKQPALGTSGVPSADVISVQGVSGATAVKVDGTGGTFPVSGTMAVTQSGTWSITGISGTVSLPTGAATAAKQPAPGIAGTPSTDVLTVQGAATMTPLIVQQGAAAWQCSGDIANAATDSGNPQKIGGLAKTTNPTAVTDGQRVNGVFDKQGKQITVGAIRQLKGVQKTSITVATETTVVTAGAAGVLNDVYAIVVTNKSATAVFVDFKDSTAGTTRMTLAAPAGDTRGFTVPVDSAMVQSTAASNWTATVSSAVTSIEISMLYVSNL